VRTPTHIDHRIANNERYVRLPTISPSSVEGLIVARFDYSQSPVIDAHKTSSQLINSIRHAAT
jgi:hypothetical protein